MLPRLMIGWMGIECLLSAQPLPVKDIRAIHSGEGCFERPSELLDALIYPGSLALSTGSS